MKITTLDQLKENDRVSVLEQVEKIFFLSTSIKEFSSVERKALFFKRWCGDYIKNYPEWFFVMLDDEKVEGYLSCCPDSEKARKVLDVPGFAAFEDQFQKFPAHLHINFHPDTRGKGLGSQLVNHVCAVLHSKGIHGFHLVTSPDAANVSFYERLGFTHKVPRIFNQMNLLFMGKMLD